MMKHVPSSVFFCTHCKRYTGYNLNEDLIYLPVFISKHRKQYVTVEKALKVATCKECGKEMELFGLTNHTVKLPNYSYTDEFSEIDDMIGKIENIIKQEGTYYLSERIKHLL